jgi:hypothetical protein
MESDAMLRKGKIYVPCKPGYLKEAGCGGWRVSPLSVTLSWRISLVSWPPIRITRTDRVPDEAGVAPGGLGAHHHR